MEAITTILTSTLLAASVSALVSILIKDKEYRNDYYKKVIDKRIKAVEAVEAMLSIFSSVTVAVKDNASDKNPELYSFFVTNAYRAEDDEFAVASKQIGQQSIWLSPTSANSAKLFVTTINKLRYEAKKLKGGENLTNHFVDNHIMISNIKEELAKSIAEDMSSLYKVKSFFREWKAVATSSR